ncbi:MAG: hypothetical protein ABIJ08_02175 [Nanoarchaeota archaeon]
MINKLFLMILLSLFILGCSQEYVPVDRKVKIPSAAVKMTPEMDSYPPILHSDDYENPVPLAVINTAGAEDSPFFSDERDELYFFFTPDVKLPVEKQILDEVTGIWVSKKVNGLFQEPERVMLQKPGKLAGDGCEFVQDNKTIFCTVREGYTGIHWFSAEYKDGKWQNWEKEDLPEDVGELHIHKDELYYHYDSGSGLDIWLRTNVGGEWINPKKIAAVSSSENEGWPYITSDGKELWFNRQYMGTPAVFRSKKINGGWQDPELIVSQFAGEPTLDKEGNIYFVHHFYEDGEMIEADIYVAYKK